MVLNRTATITSFKNRSSECIKERLLFRFFSLVARLWVHYADGHKESEEYDPRLEVSVRDKWGELSSFVTM